MGRKFIDTYIVIQENSGQLLQDFIDTAGSALFLRNEKKTILSLHFQNAVVATDGSVVFSRRAMEHLQRDGVVIYLEVSCEDMVQRLGNIRTRGIVLVAGQSLREMYDQRAPLYAKYADITINCSGGDFETVVGNVIDRLRAFQA